jgi:hypothetical protein
MSRLLLLPLRLLPLLPLVRRLLSPENLGRGKADRKGGGRTGD